MCLSEIDQLTITPCAHLFCKPCIEQCVNVSQKCPTCRRAITSESELTEVVSTVQKDDILFLYSLFSLFAFLLPFLYSPFFFSLFSSLMFCSFLSRFRFRFSLFSMFLLLVVQINTKHELQQMIEKYGTKMAHLMHYLLKLFEEDDEARVIIFSQWDKMLHEIGNTLTV